MPNMTNLRSTSPGERRKRQARESQRKSRARRRADVDILRERVRALTRALETTTGACLQLNDALTVTSSPSWSSGRIRRTLQPFLAQALSAARILEQDEDVNEDGSLQSDEEGQVKQSTGPQSLHTTTILQSVVNKRRPAALSVYQTDVTGAMSPRLTYGLWPETQSMALVPPLDIAIYLSLPQFSSTPFHIALYWNALSHAHAALTHGTSLIYKELFQYMLLFSSRGDVVGRIRRRLHFKPAAVDLIEVNARDTSQIHTDEQHNKSALGPRVSDTSEEASELAQHHSLIKQAMLQQGDTMENYLDPVAVERYLHSTWQITTTPGRVANDGAAGLTALDIQLPDHVMQHMIRRLSQSSRCLGDRIGFPVQMIDTLALDYLYTPALP